MVVVLMVIEVVVMLVVLLVVVLVVVIVVVVVIVFVRVLTGTTAENFILNHAPLNYFIRSSDLRKLW